MKQIKAAHKLTKNTYHTDIHHTNKNKLIKLRKITKKKEITSQEKYDDPNEEREKGCEI